MRPGDPILGNPHGSVTIVDFYDIRCAPCRALDANIEKLLKVDRFVRYVPIDYPLLGAASVRGVDALFAAELQGKYAALRAILMRQVAPPTVTVLKRDAAEVGLDWRRLEFDMNDDRVAARIEANLRRGRELGIQGIPVFFIGSRRFAGALSYDDLRAIVAKAKNAMKAS